MASYGDGGDDPVVDACYEQLGQDAPAVQLLRCVTSAHSTGLNDQYWQFARNILLVYSVSVCAINRAAAFEYSTCIERSLIPLCCVEFPNRPPDCPCLLHAIRVCHALCGKCKEEERKQYNA